MGLRNLRARGEPISAPQEHVARGGPSRSFGGQYEFTRVDLAKRGRPGQRFGDRVCQNGLQRAKSDGPFAAMVWGWDHAASYAYPGGMALRKLVQTPLAPLR